MRLTSQHLPRLSALALAAVLGTAHAADSPLGLSGSSVGAMVGSNATLTIGVSLSSPVLVDGMDVLFDFDPASLSFDPNLSTLLGVSWATLTSQPGFDADDDAGDGQLGFSALLFSRLVLPGSFSANLVFKGLQVGSHDVGYSVVLATVNGLEVDTLSGAGMTPITISPIPEPTPTALLLSGLAVLGWLARRRAA